MENVVELGLESIDFDPIVGHQWLRPSLESCQSGQGVGVLPSQGTTTAMPSQDG